MEVEINGRTYPVAKKGANMARCYVCNDVVPKHRMVQVGPSLSPVEMQEEERLYIYRCEDCYAGSPKWLKHYMHKSHIGKYFKTLEMPTENEARMAIGRAIVAERKRQIEEEIAKRLDARKEDGGDTGGGSVVAPRETAKGARKAVVVQKTRSKPSVRRAKISRTRLGW